MFFINEGHKGNFSFMTFAVIIPSHLRKNKYFSTLKNINT